MKNMRIVCTALTGRIMAATILRDGMTMAANRLDVTSDVLKAVIDKAEFHGGSFDISGDGKKWIVTVALEGATPQPPAPVVPLTEVGNGHADYCEALKYEGSECSCSGVSVPATVPLTTERIDAIWHGMGSFTSNDHRIFARAIEAAHMIGDKP